MKWTRDQQNAIDVRNRSVIVSAAAGSGKTAVLIERLTRIISDNEHQLPVEKMVVVTFTNAAAAEMKQRLSRSLRDLIIKNGSDPWLKRQYALLGTASISTIHAFCFDLIRKNIARFDLGADFRILDGPEEKIFSDTVISRLMEEFYSKEPDTMKLLCDNFCKGSSDKPLESLITELYTGISAMPFFESRINKLSDKYNDSTMTDIFLEDMGKLIHELTLSSDRALSMAEDLGEESVIDFLRSEGIIYQRLKELYDNKEYDSLFDFVESCSYGTYPRKSKNSPPGRDSVKKIRDHLKKTVKEKIGSYNELYSYTPEDMARHKELMDALAHVILEYHKALLKYKSLRNAIGFDDAELLVLRLLGEADEKGNIVKTDIARELSEHYRLIMVDEFQDSSDRQDMIFRLISKDGSPEKYGTDLFFVGDIKQSIYRFRLANPDNFLRAMDSAQPYDPDTEGTENTLITLNRNFRSSSGVIDFVNYCFDRLMTQKVGDVDYSRGHGLVQGTDYSDVQGNTVILMTDKSTDPDIEAKCAAMKIRSMIDNKVPVKDKNGVRPCSMRDFCILLRKKNKNNIYADALKELGLDANCQDVSGYLRSREISVLLNLLRVVDDPLLDIPAASVLMSPMFMFTADDMARLRLIDEKAPLYNNLIKITSEQEDSDDPMLSKAKHFTDLISGLRTRSAFAALPQLIQTIYDSTDFTYVIQLYKDSDRKKANLRLLLEYANSFEAASSGGISGFVKYIDKIIETKGDLAASDSGDSSKNAVSIKTMHKSKGLEYPFVFICETDSQFSTIDDKKAYQFSSELGIGFRLQNKELMQRYKTLPFEAVRIHNKNKLISEELRLLYVAMTRARQQLFITMDISEKNGERLRAFAESIHADRGISPDTAAAADRMADWIDMAVIAHKNGAVLREKFGIYESFCYDDSFVIELENGVLPDTGSFRAAVQKVKHQRDAAVMDKLRDSLSFRYDGILTDAVTKFSVSDISGHGDSETVMLMRPAFKNDDGFTAAEKGTAVHSFLQFADFNALETDFEKEKQRLVKDGHITALQSTAVGIEDIRAFLDSEIYKCIKKAKRVMRERKFMVSLDDLELDEQYRKYWEGTDGMLSGIMDMVIEMEDHLILVDYKTDKTKSLNELANRYRMQLLLYKKALEIIQDKPVPDTYIYSFHNKTCIRIDIS